MKMKRILAMILTAALLVSAVGCGGKDDTKEVLDPAKVADDMLAVFAPQGELQELVGDTVSSFYNIDSEVISGQKVYVSTAWIAEEIAVFAVKDGKESDAKKMLETRISDLKASFDGYLPDELASLEASARILTKGNLVCLLIGEGEGAAAAEKVFTESKN